jgi:tocopherol O-methyltransferase
MVNYNDKQKIIEHYDFASPYYRELWGEHLHHGYWETGSETKEEAQVALTAHLAHVARIRPGATILDVGCGFGGSSIFLAKKYNARVLGITISSVQAQMAADAARSAKVDAKFLVMDADNISLRARFDVVWSIEAISHFGNTERFFSKGSELLNPGGTLALTDWFKQDGLTAAEYTDLIVPIERGMFVELKTMSDYIRFIQSSRLNVLNSSDLTSRSAKTWELASNVIKNPAIWKLASSKGGEFLRFLRAFTAMRRGFATGSFVYGMIVAQKDPPVASRV